MGRQKRNRRSLRRSAAAMAVTALVFTWGAPARTLAQAAGEVVVETGTYAPAEETTGEAVAPSQETVQPEDGAAGTPVEPPQGDTGEADPTPEEPAQGGEGTSGSESTEGEPTEGEPTEGEPADGDTAGGETPAEQPPAEGESGVVTSEADADVSLMGQGGLVSLEIDAPDGYWMSGNFSIGVERYVVFLPWEGDGSFCVTVAPPVDGAAPTVSFDGEPGTVNDDRSITSQPFTVAQGEAKEVAILSQGSRTDGQPNPGDKTYTLIAYRTNARIHLAAERVQAADGTPMLRLDLGAANCDVTTLGLALRFDPAVMQLAKPDGTVVDGATTLARFRQCFVGAKRNGYPVVGDAKDGGVMDLDTQSQGCALDNGTGLVQLYLSAGTSKAERMGGESRALGSLYFKILDENPAAINQGTLYVDKNNEEISQGAVVYVWNCGPEAMVEELTDSTLSTHKWMPIYEGAVNYPQLVTFDGLSTSLEAALVQILDTATATSVTTSEDGTTATVVYPKGTATVTWTKTEPEAAVVADGDTLQITLTSGQALVDGLLDKNQASPLKGDDFSKTYGDWKTATETGTNLLTPQFLDAELAQGAPYLEYLRLTVPANRALWWADGTGKGFDHTQLTYTLTLGKDQTQADFVMLPQTGSTVRVAKGETVIQLTDKQGGSYDSVVGNEEELTWTAADLAHGDRLTITVTEPTPEEGEAKTTTYVVEVRRQTEQAQAHLLLERQARPGLIKASLYLTAESCRGVDVDLPLPENLIPADAQGVRLKAGADAADKMEVYDGFAAQKLTWDQARDRLYAAVSLPPVEGTDDPRRGVPVDEAPMLVFYLLDQNETPLTEQALTEALVPTGDLDGAEQGAEHLTEIDVLFLKGVYAVQLQIESYAPGRAGVVRSYYRADAGEVWAEADAPVGAALPAWTQEQNEDTDPALDRAWEGNRAGSGLYLQTITLPGLKPGLWKFQVDKPGQAGLSLEVEIVSADVDLTTQGPWYIPCGVLRQDAQQVTMADYGELIGQVGKPLDEENELCDLNGDGQIDMEDLGLLSSPENLGKTRPEFQAGEA